MCPQWQCSFLVFVMRFYCVLACQNDSVNVHQHHFVGGLAREDHGRKPTSLYRVSPYFILFYFILFYFIFSSARTPDAAEKAPEDISPDPLCSPGLPLGFLFHHSDRYGFGGNQPLLSSPHPKILTRGATLPMISIIRSSERSAVSQPWCSSSAKSVEAKFLFVLPFLGVFCRFSPFSSLFRSRGPNLSAPFHS